MQNNLYILLVDYIKNNQEKFYRVAYSYVKSHDDALDIVQDAIVKALKSYKKVRSIEYLGTWFYRILINTSLSLIKKKKLCVVVELTDYQDRESLSADHKIDLYDALDLLKSEDKTIIILRYFEDLKFQDIANITNQNINTVKTKHTKILKHLKNQLDWEVTTIE